MIFEPGEQAWWLCDACRPILLGARAISGEQK
jgi:hypothetical protein